MNAVGLGRVKTLCRYDIGNSRCAVNLGFDYALNRRHERLDTHDVYDAGEIVGEYVQRHLAGYPWQRLHQEVGCSSGDL